MSFKTKEDAVHFAEKQGEYHDFRFLRDLLIYVLVHQGGITTCSRRL
jgi:hypothetical protein